MFWGCLSGLQKIAKSSANLSQISQNRAGKLIFAVLLASSWKLKKLHHSKTKAWFLRVRPFPKIYKNRLATLPNKHYLCNAFGTSMFNHFCFKNTIFEPIFGSQNWTKFIVFWFLGTLGGQCGPSWAPGGSGDRSRRPPGASRPRFWKKLLIFPGIFDNCLILLVRDFHQLLFLFCIIVYLFGRFLLLRFEISLPLVGCDLLAMLWYFITCCSYHVLLTICCFEFCIYLIFFDMCTCVVLLLISECFMLSMYAAIRYHIHAPICDYFVPVLYPLLLNQLTPTYIS